MTELGQHKAKLQAYFDGTGFERWSQIYGDAALSSRVRRTIRAGHTRMLSLADAWLNDAQHVLDAGCGTGLLALALARRGIRVTAVDLAPQMADATAQAAHEAGLGGLVATRSGDLEQVRGTFDAVACLDVLVHYPAASSAQMLSHLAGLCSQSLVFTYAPYEAALAALHWLGGYFPGASRRTDIQMVPRATVTTALADCGMRIMREERITSGFYHVVVVHASKVPSSQF